MGYSQARKSYASAGGDDETIKKNGGNCPTRWRYLAEDEETDFEIKGLVEGQIERPKRYSGRHTSPRWASSTLLPPPPPLASSVCSRRPARCMATSKSRARGQKVKDTTLEHSLNLPPSTQTSALRLPILPKGAGEGFISGFVPYLHTLIPN